MTKDTTVPRELLEKPFDTDVLREVIGVTAVRLVRLVRLVQLQANRLPGARRKRNKNRINQRHGYRRGDWPSRAGTAELRINPCFQKAAISPPFWSLDGPPRRH